MDAIIVLKALSDETRLRLVKVLFLHEWSVNDLVHILRLGQSRISRHLRILDEANLVTVRRSGLWAYYRLSPCWESSPWLTPMLGDINGQRYEQDKHAAEMREKSHKKTTREFFDDVADRWQHLRESLLGDKEPLSDILQTLPRLERCADLGCGSGESFVLLLHHAKRVIGVDNSNQMMAIARERFLAEPRVEVRYGDLEDLPLKENEVDLVTLNLTLHHLPNLSLWAKEMQRIIRPGGYLALVDFLPHQEDKLREIYHDHWMGLEPDRLLHLLEDSFEVERRLTTSLSHSHLTLFSLLMKKKGEGHGYIS